LPPKEAVPDRRRSNPRVGERQREEVAVSRREEVMASFDMDALVNRESGEELVGFPKTKIVCTLGPKSRDVAVIEKLLRAGMSVARFNFSHGSHEYHQGTLDNLRIAQQNTQIMCAVMLDTKVSDAPRIFLFGLNTHGNGCNFCPVKYTM
jgi:hypothetical protein